MLFLDFLCLFFYIVLLNAHPISKRNSHNISELVKKLENGHIIQSDSTDKLLNHLYPTWKGQIFEEQDGNKDEINKQDFTEIPKKHIKFKRITTKVMDLRDFERLNNFGNQKFLHNSIKTHKFKDKENPEANNINQITNSQVNPISRFLENKHVFYDMSMEPTRDDTEFAGTAEIEAILNEIKQREIEMIADQIPTVSTLIANTVTETTFSSMPLFGDSSIYPGFVFSTFLLIDNNTLVNFINKPQDSHLPYLKLHNIALRSLKDDTSTLAHDVENMLQNKIKKVYRKIKKKISKDFNKEIKKTKATIKEQIDKINKKTSSSNVGPIGSRLQKDTTKPIPKTQTKPTLHEVRNSRNTLFNIQKDKLTTITTHTIPTVGDDLSMLSIVEQLLEKSEEDTAINMLTTKNNYFMKKNKEKLFKRNSLRETLKQSNVKLLNNEDLLDTDNTHSENSLNNDTENINKIKMDATTEDTSYEGLSNKLSYSDYVNGFKYYLKFQKDKEEEKYSNQVRYQAHKHHSVDDIGKFILNKIPQLPTSRSRRDFVNLKPLDVQDVSTKSGDSWFKKHFFIFMDSNTPKKFHTAQTVSLKPSATQIKSIFLDNQTTEPTYNNKDFLYLVPRHLKKNIDEAKMLEKTFIDEPRYYVKIEDKGSGIVKTPCKRSNLENNYKQKSDALTSINSRKNGFVDIDLINKPTAIIKLNKKNKKINKIRHIFNKIRFGHNKHKKKQKRQSQTRYNIFKEIRKIFKDKNQEFKEFKNTKQHKIFDYEVMTTNTYAIQSYKVPTFKKIDELRQQIPNISADFRVPQTIFTEGYLKLTDIVSTHSGQCKEKFEEKKQLGDERKSFSFLTDSQYLKDNELSTPYFIAINQTENNQKDLKIDDIINVSIETKNKDVDFSQQSNSVGYPEIMTKSIIRNEVDDLSMRLLSFDSKNEKQKTFPNSVKNGHKNQYLNLLRLNTYPKSQSSKEYQIHNIFINDLKKPAPISSPKKKNWSKKSPRNHKSTFLFSSNPYLSQIYSLSPLYDKEFQINTKSNSQDIALKTFDIQPTPLVDPTMFAYRKSLNYLIIPDKNIAASYNNNFDIIKKKPFTKVNTPPEQYYNTPLPMQMDDFYKFLKNQNIDVDSVTAPLFDSVPKGINTCNLYKKNISKLSSKHDKIIPNKQHLKTLNNKLKASGQSNKTHCHENQNKEQTKKIPAKKVQDKSRQEKKKEHAIGIDLKGKNTQLTGETPEYEHSNCNEKHKRDLRKNSDLMSRLYLGSMDLFQFDNSPKQPIVIPQKEAKEMDVTVIDLESKTIDTNAYKELEITNFNKMNKYQRLSTKTNLSKNDISRTSFIDPQRDPLRFTHMYYEHTSPKQSMTSPLYSYLHKKTTLLPTQPCRVQISGHSYKYDIIYQKPNYDWMNDLYEVNPKLFTNNVVKYRNYTTTTKMEQGDRWYHRGNYILNKNNDLISFASNKVQKKREIYNVDSLPEYTSTEVENTPLPKKEVHPAKTKAKEMFFDSSKKVNNINNIDNEVYFEPFIRHKSNRSRSQGRVSNNDKKYYKRNVQGQDLFTAKDVAALEVIVDLIKSTESLDDKGFHNSLLDIDNRKNIPYIITSLKPQNHATNAIQVHIALPSNINDKKRSLEPVKVRKIFSAIMSSPVDLEYQIHSFEDDKVTKVMPDVISPGLYLLVESTNITVPKGNFALKPIKRNLILPKSSDLILNDYNNNKTDLMNDHISKVTLNPNILAAVTNQLVKLYENMATLNETKSKKYIKEEEEENKMKAKRNINWESLKKYFGHDRLSQCRCRINKTMCKSCSASDVVITELMFEFENLAKYMNDHCTEIQTFFCMNPTGGRKLKDTVRRIDTILNNSCKRVKGKCKGRTCKSISSNIDKREYKLNTSINQFLNDLESMADYLQKVLKQNITYDANVHNAGKKCISTINNCIYKNFNKRSYASNRGELNNKSIYSLNNIRVNLICNKDLAKFATYYTRNISTEVLLERSTNTPLYYDIDEKTKKIRKNKKIGKSIKDLLKKYSNIIKFKNVETPQMGVQNNNKFVKNHIKRHSVSDNQIEAPFLADSGGIFWYKHLHDNMREPRQQKDISKQMNIKKKISHKSIFSNMNLTTITNTTIGNTTNKSELNNNLQEKANETDDTYLNIDSLNHNLNDLFKLLGNTGTVSKGKKRIQENKPKLSKLSTPSKKQFIQTTNIHTSIKTISKLTTITKVRPTSNPSSKTTFKKDHLLDSSQIEQNTKKKGEIESKTTKTVFTITPSPTSLHTVKATTSNPKVGLINRIVSGSLKFLSNSEKKASTLTGAKSSIIEHQTRQKLRLKLGANTNALKEIYHYEIDNSENSTTLTNPTIIIINDIGSSAKYTVSLNKNLGYNDSMEYLSPDTVKRNSFNLVKEKKNVESPKDKLKDIGYDSLNNRVKLKNITQKVSELKKSDYYDYDIIHSIRKYLGLTSSNLTTPSERKGAINKLIDKFSIQIIEPDVRKTSQCTISSKDTPKVDVNESVSDSSIECLNTAAITKITKNNANKDILILTTGKKNRTQNNSGSHDHRTKYLQEAGEEILNQICDISSTMAYVFKLQKSMSKKYFEQYVKNIPCHKYNKTPNHFIIRSCKRNQSKMYYKLNRKSKTSELNKDKIHKWVWIRDKRFIPETTVKYFKENKKYRCSLPLIDTNCVNVGKDNGNQEVNYHREVKKTKRITHNYNIKNKNVKDNYKLRNIIHNIGFWKINLISSYLPRRKEYKKKTHLNGNFMQLWYDDDDYYENFVIGKNGIYRKSLKRRKRLNIDMSELNDGLLNLSPLNPFTDEIYVMIANSISFDCHSSGRTKNQHEDYTWTSDRLGILDFDNVMIEGPKVFIKKIKTNNFGNYMCSAENAIVRNIKLTVIDLPNIDIVFTPLYETDTCTYDDLKSLQMLSKPMSYFTYEYDCTVRIDEPICLKDSVDGSALIRPIVVMRVKRLSNINCSAECLRDMHCSFALLFAKNAPALAFVKVLISYNGTKTILSPLRKKRKSFVTHTLRRKDTNGHREYHKLAADMDPNSVNVVLLCSAGFYLVVGQKICAVCPPNTFSLEGENVCRNCPRGASSEPGARSCRLSLHLRRKKCLWKYVCGGAVCMLSCVIASCYAVSRLLRQPVSTEEIKTCRKTGKAPRKESHQKKSKKRPLSPSRVILSRLLRGSFSSSRATDSQETRFELWKEKNTLPPLPPIDFEF